MAGSRRQSIADTADTTLVDEASATITYIGRAAPGTSQAASAWQILRIDEGANPITMLYADGKPGFQHIWNNRASLTYTA